jgi:hypothetical protein
MTLLFRLRKFVPGDYIGAALSFSVDQGSSPVICQYEGAV